MGYAGGGMKMNKKGKMKKVKGVKVGKKPKMSMSRQLVDQPLFSVKERNI
jgi:hypothetical protein